MRSTFSFTATCLFAFATSTAAQSCSAPPFYSNSAYGVKSGCIPTNYNAAADLGNTNPTDAATRCAQTCTRISTCGGWAAQLNKAADSDRYTGTCFVYTTLPATPRSCADKPSQLVAGVKDDTGRCFSSNKAAATAFCSSYLSIGQRTVTLTAAGSTTTRTSILTIKTGATSTTIIPVTVSETSTTTNVISVPTTVTQVVTTTVAAPVPVKKRAVTQPACVASAIPASQLSEQCKCLSIASATITTTVTPAPVAVRATATTTVTTAIPFTQTTLVTSVVMTTETRVTVPTETVTSVTTVTAAPTCPTPAENLIFNGGFNNGGYSEWEVRGGGTGDSVISVVENEAQCGKYSVRAKVIPDGSLETFVTFRQPFEIVDSSKTYEVQTYAKLVSGREYASDCYYLVKCEGYDKSTDTLRFIQSNLPDAWTKISFSCPPNQPALALWLIFSCTPFGLPKGPVVMGIDETYMYPRA